MIRKGQKYQRVDLASNGSKSLEEEELISRELGPPKNRLRKKRCREGLFFCLTMLLILVTMAGFMAIGSYLAMTYPSKFKLPFNISFISKTFEPKQNLSWIPQNNTEKTSELILNTNRATIESTVTSTIVKQDIIYNYETKNDFDSNRFKHVSNYKKKFVVNNLDTTQDVNDKKNASDENIPFDEPTTFPNDHGMFGEISPTYQEKQFEIHNALADVVKTYDNTSTDQTVDLGMNENDVSSINEKFEELNLVQTTSFSDDHEMFGEQQLSNTSKDIEVIAVKHLNTELEEYKMWIHLLENKFGRENMVLMVVICGTAFTCLVVTICCFIRQCRIRKKARKLHFNRLLKDLQEAEKFTLIHPSDDEEEEDGKILAQ